MNAVLWIDAAGVVLHAVRDWQPDQQRDTCGRLISAM
jgi:hypothetical protein